MQNAKLKMGKKQAPNPLVGDFAFTFCILNFAFASFRRDNSRNLGP